MAIILIQMIFDGVLKICISDKYKEFLNINNVVYKKEYGKLFGFIYILLCGVPILGVLLILVDLFIIYVLSTDNTSSVIINCRKDLIKRAKEI